MKEKNFTLETELERLLQWKRDAILHCDDGNNDREKEADHALFAFNLGLLCGLKEAKRNSRECTDGVIAERVRQMGETLKDTQNWASKSL